MRFFPCAAHTAALLAWRSSAVASSSINGRELAALSGLERAHGWTRLAQRCTPETGHILELCEVARHRALLLIHSGGRSVSASPRHGVRTQTYWAVQAPLICRVAAFRRFQTLIRAIESTSEESAFSE